jgi:hypothetical protein
MAHIWRHDELIRCFVMNRIATCVAAIAAASTLSAAALQAATIRIEPSSHAMLDMDTARAAWTAATGSGAVIEDFESFAAWNGITGAGAPLATRIGTIRGESALPGSGGSAVAGGLHPEIRADLHPHLSGSYTALSGRQNATAGGSNWLDSNDLERMIWDAGGPDLGRFDALTFLLTDVGDIRGTDFAILAEAPGMEAVRISIPRQANGTINLVRVLFDRAVTRATVTLVSARNDGFGIDNLAVSRVAAVPLPPAAALLLGGLAAIGAVRHRRRSAA